jgi:plasmid replication initiation protein
LISQIEVQDEEFKEYEFSIGEFCRVCGIDYKSGKNYQDIKQAIKEIADKSLWIALPNGSETLLRWIEKPYINAKSGLIRIRLDRDMKPFLLQLKQNFTKYELIYTLRFKSKYTIRLYEIIKSVHFNERVYYQRTFSLEELRSLLGAENYTQYKDFKKRVLEVATQEINQFSDKKVEYDEVKRGNKVEKILLTIRTKEDDEILSLRLRIDEELGGGQMTWEENL